MKIAVSFTAIAYAVENKPNSHARATHDAEHEKNMNIETAEINPDGASIIEVAGDENNARMDQDGKTYQTKQEFAEKSDEAKQIKAVEPENFQQKIDLLWDEMPLAPAPFEDNKAADQQPQGQQAATVTSSGLQTEGIKNTKIQPQ